MKKQKPFLTLLLIFAVWLGARSAQAASGNAIGAWGNNEYGQTTVPVAAQGSVAAIAAGGSHTVSLNADGSVAAWGDNEYGQTTVPAAAQSGVTAIAAGDSHTVALKNDGSVVAWGRNVEGQTTVPAGLSGVTAIAAGGYHTVALKTDGSLAAWGYNGNGQTTVPVEAQSGVIAIAAGHSYTVALKNDGAVVAWGDNEWGQTAVPFAAWSGVTAIAAGVAHTVALKSDGSVVAWGKNFYGQVTGTPALAEPYSTTASPVTLSGQVLSGVTAIAAGWYHTVALKNDGSVVAWGANGYDYGQTTVPAGLSGATAIAAGGLHTVALVIPTVPAITRQPASQTVNEKQSASFSVLATGYPLNYQWRKDGVNLAEARSATYNLGPVQTNQAGDYSVVVSNSAGSVTSAPPAVLTVNPVSPGLVAVGTWGLNDFGQTTVPVAAQSGVTAIAAGLSHTVVLKNDGSVVAWGFQTNVPVAAQSGVAAIAAGAGHTVALKNDGSVVAWGSNWAGQTNVPAGARSGVTAIATGYDHTVALKTDGSLVAWGDNGYGQTTVPVTAQSGVTAIAAGRYHTVALKNDGSVVAWGNNNYGQVTGTRTLGSGGNSATASPVTLGGQVLTGVTAIASGAYHTVALKNDGSVVAWGWNGEGRSTVPVATVPVEAQSGVTAIASGSDHILALKNDGTVVAWGSIYDGTDYITATVPPGLRGVTAIAAGGSHNVVLVIPTSPAITTQPVSQTVNAWQSASFSVLAMGYPLHYQWRKDGVNLAEPMSATYNLGPAQTNQAGGYTVVVSNSAGSVTSAPPAVLTVNPVFPGSVAVGAWGDNTYGQTTVPVAAQSGVAAIAAGLSHTVALKNDGSVVAWGYKGDGQTDVPVAAQSGVTAIAAAWSHTVALKNDGSVIAWGSNWAGQTNVPAGARSGVAAIAAGGSYTVALKTDGSLVAWGDNGYGQRTVPVTAQSGVTAIAAGGAHTVALKNDGTVVAWGLNNYGQVTGTKTTGSSPNSATASPVTLEGQVLSGVTAIAAGAYHSAALKNDGSVVAWGWNGEGRSTVPVEAQSGVTAIASGSDHILALKNDGTVVAWGSISDGTDYITATVPPGLSGVTAIAAGGSHNVVLVIPTSPAITTQPVSQTVNEWQNASFSVAATGFPLNYQWRKDGVNLAEPTSATYNLGPAQTNQAGGYTVVVSNSAGSVTSAPPAVLTVNPVSRGSVAVGAWGLNDFGQTTVPIAAQSGVPAIAAGYNHTVALKNDGSVVAWGSQTNVPEAARSGVAAIAAGGSHIVTLKNDGSVVTWGDNFSSQTPVPVGAQSGVTAIAAGGSHTVALKGDGSVVAWGGSGQATVPVAAQSGVTAIAAGGLHTVALKDNGSVVAWGNNDYGQTTVPAAAQSGVTAIAAGEFHTVVLKNDGSVVAWGSIYGGANYITATVPAGLSRVTAIAAGGGHTVALRNDGSVVAWGYNAQGQVTGTPTTAEPYSATASPVTLGGQVLSGVTAIAAGAGHTVVLVIPTAPSITTQPMSQAVSEWRSASLTVTATGFPLIYQWRKDGVDLAGATSDTYGLALVRTNQAGNYTVVVSNGAGSVTSAPPAVLTVNPPPPPLSGELDYSFGVSLSPDSYVSVSSIAVQNDGKVLIGGWFDTVNGVSRYGLARLNLDGSLDSGFLNVLNGVFDSFVRSIVMQRDGKVLIGASGLARLNADGTLDSGFLNGDPGGYVSSVAVQTDGKVLVGFGGWSGAVPSPGLVRLNADGTLDSGFQTGVEVGIVRSIAAQSDGKLLIGGETVFDAPAVGLARLNADGTLDSGFQSGLSSSTPEIFYPVIVRSIAVQSDGKVLVGGYFVTVDGVSRNSIARLNADGTLDSGFLNGLGGLQYLHSGLNGGHCFWCAGAYSIALQSDGKVLVGGVFDTVNGVSRNSIARLNADGTLDSGFLNGLAGIESYLGSVFGGTRGVFSIALQSDNNVVVGGRFDMVNGVPAANVARLWGIADAPPQIKTINRSGTAVNLSWDALPSRIYRVQYKDNLSASAWVDLAGDISATGNTASNSDSTLGNVSARFYRVVLLP